MICVPLVHRVETVGVLKVYLPEARHFKDHQVETLGLLSELIAAHISHATRREIEPHESRHDALTALLNRRAFDERLPVEAARATDMAARSPSACSTSMASRGSMTGSATRPGTRCCAPLRGSSIRLAPLTIASGSAGTSSRS